MSENILSFQPTQKIFKPEFSKPKKSFFSRTQGHFAKFLSLLYLYIEWDRRLKVCEATVSDINTDMNSDTNSGNEIFLQRPDFIKENSNIFYFTLDFGPINVVMRLIWASLIGQNFRRSQIEQ